MRVMWLLHWLLVTSLAALIAPGLRLLLDSLTGFRGSLYDITMTGVSAGLLYGAQAVALPAPLQGLRGRWLAYGVTGMVLGGEFGYPLVAPLFDLLPAVVPLRSTITYVLMQALIPAVLHWTLLRSQVTRAWRWFPALVVGVVLVIPLTWASYLLRPWLTSYEAYRVFTVFLMRLGPNLTVGAALWWLFHHERTST
jgi:hypothetical protein